MRGKGKPPSKRQVEVHLGKLKILENPSLALEQYPVSPEAAAELLYLAGFEHHDMTGDVIDLGTGTGRLAIGAALMGGSSIVGVDLDPRAVALAKENAANVGVEVDWVVGDLDAVNGSFDSVVMNPPYGTRSPHNDVRFLSKAFELAAVTYSIHKSSTRQFLVRFIAKQQKKVDEVRSMVMQIPRLFEFHRKKWEEIRVDLYRIVS